MNVSLKNTYVWESFSYRRVCTREWFKTLSHVTQAIFSCLQQWTTNRPLKLVSSPTGIINTSIHYPMGNNSPTYLNWHVMLWISEKFSFIHTCSSCNYMHALLCLPMPSHVHSWYWNQGSCESMNSLSTSVSEQKREVMLCRSVLLMNWKMVVELGSNWLKRAVMSWKQ